MIRFLKRYERGAGTVLIVCALVLQLGQPLFRPLPVHALTNSWTFDTAGDYTLSDSAKIQVTGGQAQLGRTPAWWDTSYAYRQQLTVTAGSTAITSGATGDTITLNADIAALVTAGKVQPDQDDLRVVYWNGTTNTNIDREYQANGLGTALGGSTLNNDVRFKAQAAINASATDTGYYLYYGNGSATPGPQDRANIYRYYEPFNAAGTWDLTHGTGWTITSGRLKKTTRQGDNYYAGDEGTSFSGTSSWNFESIHQHNDSTASVSLGFLNAINPSSTGFWLPTYPGADMEIWRFGGSGGKLADGSGNLSITTDTDYRQTIQYNWGGTCTTTVITGWFDGVKRVSATNNNAGACPANLIAGVHTWNNNWDAGNPHGEWDDYKVWKSLGETVSQGSEETVYPSDDPTVEPTVALTLNKLTSFSETATKNSGEIKYILSNDGGTTWLYHNGSGWVTSDGSYAQSTTAANANSNAATFPGGSGSFKFRAFLHSNGSASQQVLLDTVTVNGNVTAGTPALSAPSDAGTVTAIKPTLQLAATDGDSDYVRYKIQLDTVNTFNSANLQAFDQTATQTGWSGQDSQGSTAYTSGTAATYTLQAALSPNTTYYWRAAALDPAGINAFGSYSTARSFVTPTALTAGSITATSLTSTGATIAWSTSREATTTLEYGASMSYGTTTSVSGTRTSHSVTLTGLTPNTVYHYRISGTDATGQSVASADQTLTTLSGSITNIQVSGLTTTGALVSWTTNIATTSRVEYGTTSSYGSTASSSDSTTSHQIALTGLQPGTAYHYRVSGTDSGGSAITSADQTLTTLENTVITNVTVTPLSSRSVKVTWTTNHAADSKVRYGKTTDYGSEVYDPTLVTSHAIVITSLEPNTAYHYEVLSVGNTSTNDADATFSSSATVPTILEPLADATFTSAQAIRVIGVAPSGQTVRVYVDGELDGTTVATKTSTGTGSFSYLLKKKLTTGTHSLAVQGVSGSNESPMGEGRSITISLPAVPPTVLEPIVTDGNEPTVTIRGLAPSGARVDILIDGKKKKSVTTTTTKTGTGSFAATLDVSTLAAGKHTVQVIAYGPDDRPSKARTAATFTVKKNGAVTPRFKASVRQVVVGGDSLWRIAEQRYGDGRLYPKLVRANEKKFPSLKTNPSLIQPGWVLTIPK